MHLSNLPIGDMVNLDMIKGSEVFETTTRVVGISSEDEHAVLLEPFEYRGKTLDLGNRGVDNVIFNLYANNEEGNRVGWLDVNVSMRYYGGKNYYIVHASGFSQLAKPSDRRNHQRFEVHMPGLLNVVKNGATYNVDVYDVSDNGISFLSKEKLDIMNQQCKVYYTEVVNEKDYDLEINCRCVRSLAHGNQYFYGCSVSEASNRMLSYVYIKKILTKRD